MTLKSQFHQNQLDTTALQTVEQFERVKAERVLPVPPQYEKLALSSRPAGPWVKMLAATEGHTLRKRKCCQKNHTR